MRSVCVFMAMVAISSGPAIADDAPETAMQVFKQRIEPILNSLKASSCSECHLSGVDLKDYLKSDQAATFTALREAGLIDLKQPDSSKLLKFISRKPARPSLITDKIRQQEFEAVRAWIRLASKDPELLKAKLNKDDALDLSPVEVIRHARQDHVLQSFMDNVWSEVGRCAACHSPDRNDQQRKKHGEKVSWIKPRDPAGTLAYMVEAKLINVDAPEDSPLLLKPTLQIPHGGGQKLEIGDRTYKQFVAFLTDYSKVVKAAYQTADQLPPARSEISNVTDIWLKIEGVPEKFHKQLLQVDVHRKESGGWSKTPWAIGDRAVFGPNKLWQQHLTAVAPAGSDRAKKIAEQPDLRPGKYLVRISVDQQGQLKKDPTSTLTEADQVGEVEVETRWPVGYGQMTIIKYPSK